MHLGSFLEASWGQFRPNMAPTWPNMASKWRNPGGSNCSPFGVCFGSWGLLGPKKPKMASKTPQDLDLGSFWGPRTSILGGFGAQVGPKLGHVGPKIAQVGPKVAPSCVQVGSKLTRHGKNELCQRLATFLQAICIRSC